MVLITVGTGIGGGVVMGGQLIRGAHGIAGELGHVMAVRDGRPCGCGAKGCLEQYSSGNALTRYARAGAQAQPDQAATLLKLVGGDIGKLTGPLVTEAANAGDPVAIDAFAQIGYWLGRGLADLVQILDPQVLVVGGGVIDAGDLLLTPARAAFLEGLPSRATFPVATIVAASMGNSAGVVGAADLARRR
jgi:glucokinase